MPVAKEIIVERNVVFGDAGTEYLTADLYRPDRANGELPVLVRVHGGAFQTGSKEMYRDWGPELARHGYFVMAINYRLATAGGPTFPAVLQDLAAGMRWLVSQAAARALDVNRIGLVGDSAGAHLASLLALKQPAFSYAICAVVGVYGVYDLPWEWQNPVSERAHGMFEQLLGHALHGHEALYRDASPMNHVDSATQQGNFDTAFLLLWGAQDKVVNPEQSRRFAHALAAAQIRVKTREIGDAGHFWFNLLPQIDGGRVADYPNSVIADELLQFLEDEVRNSDTTGYSRRRLRLLAASQGLTCRI